MKHPLSLDDILAFICQKGLAIGQNERRKLIQYAELVQTWSKRQSLISYGDRPHVYERHFLPGFFLLSKLSSKTSLKVIDIGSGAGFLAVMLAIIYPESEITAIDSSRKKCLFLQEVNSVLNLNMSVVHQRIEVFNTEKKNTFDFAISRAVTDLAILWTWVRPILSETGRVLALKGGDVSREILGLVAQGVKNKIYEADITWTCFSPYLTEKFLVELETEND